MTNDEWFLLIGGLLLAMDLTSSVLKRSPVTSAIIYLAIGLLVGPTGLNLFHFNPLKESALLEVLTEVAVLISLFLAGVKMPVPFSGQQWRAPILLATDVQSRHPGDRDQLRFKLTCEAGLNDGSAFPFVVLGLGLGLGLGLLGLHDLGDLGWRWLMIDVVCATGAGIAIGVVAGTALAHAVAALRRPLRSHHLLDDFVGLGLIGVVYGLSVQAGAWGFLAVFFAAVALRQTETRLAKAAAPPAADPPTNAAADSATHPADLAPMMVGEGSLIFKEHLERLSELVLVLLVGGSLFFSSWSWDAVALALFLFVVDRPVGVFTALLGQRTPLRIQGMTAWFGVRGIGSLYCLMYAIQHGLPEPLALKLVQLTLIVVTLSILLHGFSVKPLLGLVRRRPLTSA